MLRETAGDLPEDQVSRGVTMIVVDALEAIEVEKHHRQAPTVPLGQRDSLRDAIIEQDTIGQSRCRVMQRPQRGMPLFLLSCQQRCFGFRKRRARPGQRDLDLLDVRDAPGQGGSDLIEVVGALLHRRFDDLTVLQRLVGGQCRRAIDDLLLYRLVLQGQVPRARLHLGLHVMALLERLLQGRGGCSSHAAASTGLPNRRAASCQLATCHQQST